MYDWVDATPGVETVEVTDEAGVRHWFRYLNGVPLNDAHFELEVNFLEYWERRPNGKEQHFAWVTDLPIKESTVMELMRAGRARWRIENETFNTLKNQGYSFEHNFGHGEKQLSTVFAYLMMLAFLIDPDSAALLPGVPTRAGEGGAGALFLGEGAGAVPALPAAGLGDAVSGARLRVSGAGADPL